MADKPFLLFGRKEGVSSEEARYRAKLEELKSELSGQRRLLEQARKETSRIISDAEKRLALVEKEEQALKSLRDDVGKRVQIAEKKDAELRESERDINRRSGRVESELSRFAKLKKEAEELSLRISQLEKVAEEKRSEAQVSIRMAADAKRSLEQAKKEEQALAEIRRETAKKIQSAEKTLDSLSQRERAVEKGAAQMRAEEARLAKLKHEEASLSAHISDLEKVLDDKKRQANERQKTVMILTKEMSELVSKRAAAEKVERMIRDLLDKEKQLRAQLPKIEARIADGARIIAKQEEEIERHKSHVQKAREEAAQVPSMRKELKNLIDESHDLKQALDVDKKEKSELQAMSAKIAQRERAIASREAELARQQQKLEQLSAEVEHAQQDKQEALAVLSDKKRVLQQLQDAIKENSRLVAELHEHETSARKAAQTALHMHHDVERKLKSVETKENAVNRRESAWLEHNKMLKDAQSMLEKERKDFEDQIKESKAELSLLQQEWEKRLEGLKSEKSELQSVKSDVRKLVEDDVAVLKEKEDELARLVETIERDKQRLYNEERDIVKRVKELERGKAAFEKEKQALEDATKKKAANERIIQKSLKYIEQEKKKIENGQDEIYRAKQLRKMLPALERKYNAMQRSYGHIEARVIDRGIQPRMRTVLKEKEKELNLRERGIELETRRLMEREHETEALERREERAFEEYLREEVERVTQGKPGREIAHPEIHAVIDDARERLMRGNVDEAIRLVAQLELLVQRIQNVEERRTFEYDIRDLKTSIKLATLA